MVIAWVVVLEQMKGVVVGRDTSTDKLSRRTSSGSWRSMKELIYFPPV
jgi:hypothetical protein